jgi:hypothetical protein
MCCILRLGIRSISRQIFHNLDAPNAVTLTLTLVAVQAFAEHACGRRRTPARPQDALQKDGAFGAKVYLRISMVKNESFQLPLR